MSYRHGLGALAALSLVLPLSPPAAVRAATHQDAQPFLEYSTRSGEYFTDLVTAAASDMRSLCGQIGFVDCRLERSAESDVGYAYDFSHVISGTPGGPDEQRLRQTARGLADYSCPIGHVLYSREDGVLNGPFQNRDIGPWSGADEVYCAQVPASESAYERQSDLGTESCAAGSGAMVGNPINVGAGNKFQSAVDLAPTEASPLIWERFYNSGVVDPQRGDATPTLARLGSRWRSTYDRSLAVAGVPTSRGEETGIRLFRHTGERIDYIQRGSRYESVVDPRGLLRREGDGWMYRTPEGELETYDEEGRLTRIEGAAGKRIDLKYSTPFTPPDIAPEGGLLIQVTDQYGRQLTVSYDNEGRVASVRRGTESVAYGYSGGDRVGRLADLVKAIYADESSVTYLYNESEYVGGGTLPHRLTGIIDERGRRYATYSYDARGQALSTEHAGGVGTHTINYSPDLAQAFVRGPTGGVHTYTFENVRGSQRLVGVDQPGGAGCGAAFSKIEYGDDGKPTARTDFDGTMTRFKHDADSNEIERVEAADTPHARTTTTDWHDDLLLPVHIASPGYEETLSYDARGNVTQRRVAGAVDPSDPSATPSLMRTWTAAYDARGQLLYVDGPRSDSKAPQRLLTRTYRASADAGCSSGGVCAYRQGDLWKIENALGQAEEILAYNADGRVLRRRDSNGIVISYTYSARGWLETETRTDPQGVSAVTRFDYTPSGQVARITDADGVTLDFDYDDAHRLIAVTDAAGNHTRYTLDAAAQRTAEQVEDKDGVLARRLSRTYDLLGRIATETDAYDHTTSHTYDVMHRWTGSTNAGGVRTSASYDALGRLRETIGDIDGVKARVVAQHDPLDQLMSVTDPKGLTTAYLTTGLGDLSHIDSPDTGKTWNEYDETGALSVREAAGGVGSHSITRDALGRILTKTFADPALTVRLTYDVADTRCPVAEQYSIGRRSSMTDASGDTAYCYDSAGRLARTFHTRGAAELSVAYRYTKAGRLAGISLPDGGTVTWRNDALGQVTGIDVTPTGGAATPLLSDVTWNALGNVAGWTYGNGRRLARSYDANGRPVSVTDPAPGGLNHTLRYDEAGYVTRLDTQAASRTYTYDGLGRLIATRDAKSDLALHQYTYDPTGNRTSVTVGAATDRYIYAADSHHLTTADGQARRYDAVGNTVAIGGLESMHDAAGQLASIRRAGATLASYRYTGDGQRATRIESTKTTHTIYDAAGHWLGDYDAEGTAIAQAIWLGHHPVGLIVDGRVFYVESDHLGTPRAVIDPVRNVAVWQWKLEGEAFGSDYPDEDPDADGAKFTFNLRFPGQIHDAVSGLHYNYFRYFDPVSGRYIQSDPIGLAGGMSTYAYVENNPNIRIDPHGLDFAIVIDDNAVQSSLGAHYGHSAFLVGDNERGCTYYSKDGGPENVKGTFASLDSFMRSMNGRYKSGVVLSTNRIQDMDVRRWADAHYQDRYSAISNNCADLVYGGLDAAGIDANRPMFMPSIPNRIIERMDFSSGRISTSGYISNPYWHPGLHDRKYK